MSIPSSSHYKWYRTPHTHSIYTHNQVAFALLDKYISPVAKLLWSEAFNLRVGTQVTALLCKAQRRQGMYILVYSRPHNNAKRQCIYLLVPITQESVQSKSNLTHHNHSHPPRTTKQGQSTAAVWMTAERTLGIPAQQVPTLPEQDAWQYHTWKGTPNGRRAPALGRSMVCCVFVCGCVSRGLSCSVCGGGVDGGMCDPSCCLSLSYPPTTHIHP